MTIRYVHGTEKQKVENGEMDPGRATLEWDPEDSMEHRRWCQAHPPAPKPKPGFKMTLPQWLSALLFVLFLLGAMVLATLVTGY